MSELPSISTMNTTADTNKQLSQMRSYLNQLKDSTEAEINNVTYDMLSGALRKKIDNMEQNISTNSTYTSLVAETLSASYVKTDVLDAQIARIDTISANYITASEVNTIIVNAGLVNASEVNALIGNYSSLNADHITSGTLSADRISASTITSKLNGQQVTCSRMGASYVSATNGFYLNGREVKRSTTNIAGTTIKYLKWEGDD